MGCDVLLAPPGECKYNTVVQLQHEPQLCEHFYDDPIDPYKYWKLCPQTPS